MCNQLEVSCSNEEDKTDYGYIKEIVENNFKDVDYIVSELSKELEAKFDKLSELILKLNGFDPYRKNPKDLRFKVRKDVELLADEFSLLLNNPKSS